MKNFIFLILLSSLSFPLFGQVQKFQVNAHSRLLINFIWEDEFRFVEHEAVQVDASASTEMLTLKLNGRGFEFRDPELKDKLNFDLPGLIELNIQLDAELIMPTELQKENHFFSFNGELVIDHMPHQVQGFLELRDIDVGNSARMRHYTWVVRPENVPGLKWPEQLAPGVEIEWYYTRMSQR